LDASPLDASPGTTADPRVRLQLLGTPHLLTQSGAALSLPHRKSRALLAYLAQTNRPHTRSSLSALFCQHSLDPARALRWHLSVIRRHLGAGSIITETGRVQFNPQHVQVDASTFAAVLSGDLAHIPLVRLRATLAMYRGQFLDSLSLPDAPEFELWLLGQRAYFHHLYERGLSHLVGRLIADQAYETAMLWAQQLVQTNPLLEEGHTDLIWLYARLGERQAALDQYNYCRRLLKQELDTEPGPALVRLAEAIRAKRSLPPHLIHSETNAPPNLTDHMAQRAQQGDLFDMIWRWAPLAAVHIRSLHAYADALALYEAALVAFNRLPDHVVPDPKSAIHYQIEHLLACVQLGHVVGRPPATQAAWLQTAADLLAQHPQQRLEGLLFLCQATLMATQGRYETAVTTALAGYERLRHLDEPRQTASCLVIAAEARLRLSHNRAAQSLFAEALALFQAAGDTEGESRCRSGIAHAAVNLGQVEVAIAQLDEALAMVRQQDNPLAEARVCLSLAHAWTYYYDAERINYYAYCARQLFEQAQYDLLAMRAQSYLGVARRFSGDTTGAKAIYEQVLAMAQGHNDRWQEGWMAQALGRIAFQAGEVAAAERWFEQARDCRQESGEAQNLVSDLLWLGRLRLAQERPEEALRLLSAAVNQLEAGAADYYVYESWDVYFSQAEALAALGQADQANTWVRRAYETLLAFAVQIPDDSRRRSFLTARPLVRLLMAYAAGQIPPYYL
jgi:DNA-binding SARP family transcriptional activator